MEIGPDMYKADGDRAVSPVIGVILMVAITVILAAVIAAFVLGIGPGDDPVEASVDIDGDGTNNVEISVTSADNADQIVVADGGEIVGYMDASTGNSANFGDDAEETHNELGDNGYTVWATLGELDDDNDLDDADGSIELGEFELEGTT